MDPVETATRWAKAMVRREARGHGDRINAMRRIADRYGIPYGVIWNLFYRPPRDVGVTVFLKLQAAYQQELDRGLDALKAERASTNAKTEFGARLFRATDFVADTQDGDLNE